MVFEAKVGRAGHPKRVVSPPSIACIFYEEEYSILVKEAAALGLTNADFVRLAIAQHFDNKK